LPNPIALIEQPHGVFSGVYWHTPTLLRVYRQPLAPNGDLNKHSPWNATPIYWLRQSGSQLLCDGVFKFSLVGAMLPKTW